MSAVLGCTRQGCRQGTALPTPSQSAGCSHESDLIDNFYSEPTRWAVTVGGEDLFEAPIGVSNKSTIPDSPVRRLKIEAKFVF